MQAFNNFQKLRAQVEKSGNDVIKLLDARDRGFRTQSFFGAFFDISYALAPGPWILDQEPSQGPGS